MKHANVNIEELGLTKQREVVLQVIRDAQEHLMANEVFDRAKTASTDYFVCDGL